VNRSGNGLRFGKRLLRVVSILLLAAGTCVYGQEGLQFNSRTVKRYIRPVYPELARRMNLKGMVRLEVVITAAGKVSSVKAVGGHPLLAQSAAMAVQAWVFTPGPQETTANISINFE
jgi:TonB family protein